MKKFFYLFMLLSLVSSKCKKNDPPITNHGSLTKNKVFVLNEGGFGKGNASFGIYNPDSQTYTYDVFKMKNGIPLGDVLQSMNEYGGSFYFVLNNSQKIVVTDTGSLRGTSEIIGAGSPRYIQFISSTKAYVTDLTDRCIWIMNPSNGVMNTKIKTHGWTEQLCLYDTEAFVCLADTGVNKVLVVNTNTDLVTDSITVGEQPQWMVKDKNSKIWVLCSGSYTTKGSTLKMINPANHTVEKSISLSATANPSKLKINGTGDTLYWLDGGVYKMPISATTVPASAFIAKLTDISYGLGVDPKTNEIYLTTTPADYSSPGHVWRFSASGSKVDDFGAGTLPGDLFFRK